MGSKVAYWVSTVIISVLSGFAAYAYLSGNPEAVRGFAAVGYPQQLRVMLGIAKPLGAIVLLIPGFLRLKEWAYAGFSFAWISAFIAHYLAGQHKESVTPLILLALLVVSYFTRPADRKLASARADQKTPAL
jgi:hypothetical protein